MQHSLMLASGNITEPSSSFAVLMKAVRISGRFHLVSTKPFILCPEMASKVLKCSNLFESLQDIQRRIMVVTSKVFAVPE